MRLDAIAAKPLPAASHPQDVSGDAPVLLSVRGLSKAYGLGGRFGGKAKGSVRAVDNVSLDARAGRTLAIVGESGCGKSTLARVISGLTPASSGEALFRGANLAALPVDKRPDDLRRRIQMVFQNPDSTLNPSHTIEFALLRPLRRLRGMNRAEARNEVRRLIDRVRLAPDVLRCLPHQLSGGQRQRVAVARALAGNPDLLIADEPVSALDVSVQAAIVNLLSDILEQSQIGLAIISHDLALVRHMADWVAVMYLGKVVEYGPADQVFAPPFHPYTDALLAAAPEPDPDAGPPRVVLGGAMPSPAEQIRGCVFASRCPRKIGAICDTVVPPVRQFGKHTIVCHLELSARHVSRSAELCATSRVKLSGSPYPVDQRVDAAGTGLCAHAPSANARGCRSSGQALASTSVARGPATTYATRLAETSNSAPPAALKASRVNQIGRCRAPPATSNHERGPSQNTLSASLRIVVFGAVGSTVPNIRGTASPNGRLAGSPCTSPAHGDRRFAENEVRTRDTVMSWRGRTDRRAHCIRTRRRAPSGSMKQGGPDPHLRARIGERRHCPQRFAVARARPSASAAPARSTRRGSDSSTTS